MKLQFNWNRWKRNWVFATIHECINAKLKYLNSSPRQRTWNAIQSAHSEDNTWLITVHTYTQTQSLDKGKHVNSCRVNSWYKETLNGHLTIDMFSIDMQTSLIHTYCNCTQRETILTLDKQGPLINIYIYIYTTMQVNCPLSWINNSGRVASSYRQVFNALLHNRN